MSGWNVVSSDCAARTKNPIRNIVDRIQMPVNPSKPIIPLSLGDPTSFGNLPSSDTLVELMTETVQSRKYDGYLPSYGLTTARCTLAQEYSEENNPLTENDVIISCGGSGALDTAIRGLVNPGDNILIPCPAFSLYRVVTESIGASCKSYRLIPERQWECDIPHMESLIDENTKAILINNPSNPCGNVFSEEHLREIISLAERHRLPIISDEIYGDMVFSPYQFVPIARVSSSVPMIVTGGMAKQFSVPGWRVGWILVYDQIGALKEYKKGLNNLTHIYLGPNSTIQAVIPSLFQRKEELAEYKNRYYSTLESHAMVCVEKLKDIPGLTVIPPQGTMYLMIKINIEMFADIEDDRDFCEKLLREEFVFALPGQCFGVTNFFRCVFCAPQDKLSEAFDRINLFCHNHLKK